MPSLFKTVFSVTLLAASLSAQAAKINIDFDDIQINSNDGVYDSISNGYAGLTWDNFGVVNGAQIPNTGYEWGTVTGANAAFNLAGLDASFSSGSDKNFTLFNLMLTAAWQPATVEFYGYDNGQLKNQLTVATSNITPVLVHFNWTNIDSVKLHVTNGDVRYQQVVDNLKLEFTAPPPVPEPETYAMLLAGLGLVAYGRRRTAGPRA